jgi:hypothetical protein
MYIYIYTYIYIYIISDEFGKEGSGEGELNVPGPKATKRHKESEDPARVHALATNSCKAPAQASFDGMVFPGHPRKHTLASHGHSYHGTTAPSALQAVLRMPTSKERVPLLPQHLRNATLQLRTAGNAIDRCNLAVMQSTVPQALALRDALRHPPQTTVTQRSPREATATTGYVQRMSTTTETTNSCRPPPIWQGTLSDSLSLVLSPSRSLARSLAIARARARSLSLSLCVLYAQMSCVEIPSRCVSVSTHHLCPHTPACTCS